MDNLTKTIKTYEDNIQRYIDNTSPITSGEYIYVIDDFLAYVDTNADILEIGSGTGRDADYIESLGYRVVRTDITNAFLQYQISQGKKVQIFDILTDSLDQDFDLIIANAVFLHFTDTQFRSALKNTYGHLRQGGYFFIRMKKGVGEGYTDHKMDAPRYFNYWMEGDLCQELKKVGFEIVTCSNSKEDKWINILCLK